MRHRIVLLATALLAAALVAAGCQSPDERDYVEDVNAVQTEMADTLNSGIGTDDESTATAVEAFGEQVTEFSEIDPPESVADEHDELLKILQDIEKALGVIVDPKASAADKQTAITDATKAATDSDLVIDKMNEEFSS